MYARLHISLFFHHHHTIIFADDYCKRAIGIFLLYKKSSNYQGKKSVVGVSRLLMGLVIIMDNLLLKIEECGALLYITLTLYYQD